MNDLGKISIKIKDFISNSVGEWRSMRSGHSLAFQQFEEIKSKIIIEELEIDDANVREVLKKTNYKKDKAVSPFKMNWEAESDWNDEVSLNDSNGSCYLIPIPKTLNSGLIIRSTGYAEQIQAVSIYNFLNDESFVIKTKYAHSRCEEKIWFPSENFRCRASIIFSKDGNSILQTSFASEIKKLT